MSHRSQPALCVLLLASVPAFSQFDATGEWSPRLHEDQGERMAGPDLGDYLGLPINAAARLSADSWDASLLTLPENQCRPIRDDYPPRGPSQVRISKQVDAPTQQLVAYHMLLSWMTQERTIYVDGRPHPPGYGKWEGNILTATTTHLKAGWIRRNRVPRSERATLTEHWIRHDNYLTIDPFLCEAVVEVAHPNGYVPHHLPGANPFLSEFSAKYELPQEAVRGGAETMYPEYQLRLAKSSAAAR